MRCLLLPGLALAALAACGDSVIVHTGAGGSPATTTPTPPGTTTWTTTSTTTPPPTEQPCGAAHPPCPPYEYCEIPGLVCDAQGICTTKPFSCDDDCPGVCGCDGQAYCNECEAKSKGTDIGPGNCWGDDVEYAVAAWPGGVDHMVIMKANYGDDTCWRIYLDAPSPALYQINVPPPWGIVGAAATNSATDCLDWQAPQQGSGNVPFIGYGDITWQLESGMFYPCELAIDVVMVLEDTPPPNLKNSEPFTAQDLVVVGGCF